MQTPDSQSQEVGALPEPVMGEFLTPAQVREAILAWAHDHHLFPPHLDFGDTCRASVIVREDGAAVIEVFAEEPASADSEKKDQRP